MFVDYRFNDSDTACTSNAKFHMDQCHTGYERKTLVTSMRFRFFAIAASTFVHLLKQGHL